MNESCDQKAQEVDAVVTFDLFSLNIQVSVL